MFENLDEGSLDPSNGLISDNSSGDVNTPMIQKKKDPSNPRCFASFFKCNLGPCSNNKGLRIFGIIAEILIICAILGGIIAGIVIGVGSSSGPIGVCNAETLIVSFPESVTSIKASTVPKCFIATRVVIGKNVTNISSTAFDGLFNLERFTVEEGSITFTGGGGVLYKIAEDRTYELLRVPINYLEDIAVIPHTKKILKHSFYNCSYPVVVVNDELETIETDAFAESFGGKIVVDENNEFLTSVNKNGFTEGIAHVYEKDFQSNKTTVTIKGVPHTKKLDKKSTSRLLLRADNSVANSLERKIEYEQVDEEYKIEVEITYKDGDIEMPFQNKDSVYVSVNNKLYIPEVVNVGEPTRFVRDTDGLESLTLTDDEGVTVNVLLDNSITTIQGDAITFLKMNHYVLEGKRNGESSTQEVNVALKECKDNPQTVTVPEGVTNLPSSSFHGCYNTTIIVIPSSVENIHKSALSSMEHKEVVVVDTRSPAKVENCDLGSYIDDNHVEYSSIPVIRYDFSNPPVVVLPSNYIGDNYSLGFVFNAKDEGDKLLLYGENTVDEDVVVYEEEYVAGHKGMNFLHLDLLSEGEYELRSNSNTVASIGVVHWSADQDNMGVPNNAQYGTFDLVIPYGVEKIGYYQYQYNFGIRSVVIPPTVLIIGENAFENCFMLVDVTISRGVREIKEYALKNIGVKNITVPGSVDIIGAYAFEACGALESIVLEEGIMALKDGAFSHLNLTQIMLPSSITDITANPFDGCTSLDVIQSHSPRYPTSSNFEFGSVDGILITFMCWKTDAPVDYVVPDTYNTIAWRVFAGCQNTKSVTLDRNITRIDSFALSYCSSLETVVVSESLKYVGIYLFAGSPKLTQFSFPYSLWKDGETYSCLSGGGVKDVCFVRVNGECPTTLGESIEVYGAYEVNAVCSDVCPNVI